jgi:alpha-mannosidase
MKDFITGAIRAAIERETRALVEKESALAAKRVQDELGRRIDAITLEILQMYDISKDRDLLTIRVRKLP